MDEPRNIHEAPADPSYSAQIPPQDLTDPFAALCDAARRLALGRINVRRKTFDGRRIAAEIFCMDCRLVQYGRDVRNPLGWCNVGRVLAALDAEMQTGGAR